MSAILCGKRSLFEEHPTTPPSSKRIRCFSTSPILFSPFSPSSSAAAAAAFDQLRSIFPDMDNEFLDRALKECGGDLNSAIKSLNELRLGSAERNLTSSSDQTDLLPQAVIQIAGEDMPSFEDQSAAENVPKNGAEWVELFVREMMSASNMDDARVRASRVLEVIEKSIRTHAIAEATENFHKENIMLKEQMEVLMRDNTILKRGVAIQHERQKEFDDRSQDLQNLKQVVAQYQEKLKTLEVSNYALMMHLRQAQQSNSIPGHFHPDVF